jgi:poly-gamma-glutamate capsule biosynthesis protein CapA/YwtB (metallophosphatase superfamily)
MNPQESNTKYIKRNSKKVLGVSLAVAALVLLAAFGVFIYALVNNPKPLTDRPYRIEISEAAKPDLVPLVDQFAKTHPKFEIEYSGSQPDIIIATRPRDGYDASRIEVTPALELRAGYRSIPLREGKVYWFLSKKKGFIFKKKDKSVESLENFLTGYYGKMPVITMNAGGDIIPGRHVAQRMARYGTNYPFEKVAPYFNGADIEFGDLECPLTDRVKPPYAGMSFVAPSKTIGGIKLLGINVVALANNHSTNFGREAFTDTLELLKANNIEYTGGGYNYDEAHAPAVMDVKGFKFAFLSYNSIIGSIDATGNQAGVAHVGIPPWYPENPQQIAKMEDDIRKAKANTDFVIVALHWSQEDVYMPSASMRNLAHRACDAGADMVLGSHPHTIQPIEFYNGKFIAYSMGNFIFDQMQRDQTREGFFIKCRFRENLLTGLEMVPYKIYDFSQPRVFEGSSGQYLLDKVLRLSGWIQ